MIIIHTRERVLSSNTENFYVFVGFLANHKKQNPWPSQVKTG